MHKMAIDILKLIPITGFVALAINPAFAASCRVTSNTVTFGTYDVFSGNPLNSTGTIQVHCSPGGTSYTVSLNNGLYGPITHRKMKSSNGNQTIEYNLYVDATYTVVWGDGTGNSVVVRENKPGNLTVYAQIPPQQDVPIGTYNDAVTVTVSF